MSFLPYSETFVIIMSFVITGSAFDLRNIHRETDRTSGINLHNAFFWVTKKIIVSHEELYCNEPSNVTFVCNTFNPTKTKFILICHRMECETKQGKMNVTRCFGVMFCPPLSSSSCPVFYQCVKVLLFI